MGKRGVINRGMRPGGTTHNPRRIIDYRRDLDIDIDDLLDEWKMHGHRYMDYVEANAQAEFEKNIAKQAAGIARSDAARDIRRNPQKYGVDGRPTDKTVKDLVECHPDVVKADRRYFNAVKNEKIIDRAAHTVGSYRKTALENILFIIMQGVHSRPRVRVRHEDVSQMQRAALKEQFGGDDND